MRIANIKTGSLTSPTKKLVIIDGDKTPCFYADIEKAEKRKEWRWKVGCKYFGAAKDEEYAFKISKAGDVDDEQVWQRMISAEFAIELISLFKDGGELAVKNWIKQGCP